MRQRRPIEERFWEKVSKTDGCWLWTGATNGKYGKIGNPHKLVYAHHVAWELAFCPVPDGLWVLHHCDNPLCVRPDHLWLGTNRDNDADRDMKGRHRYGHQQGQKNGNAVLTDEAVKEIRRLAQRGYNRNKPGNTADLAQRFGVTNSIIRRVARGGSWKHIE